MALVLANPSSAPNFVVGNVRPVFDVAAATTLTAAQSGSIINVSKAAAYDITLPAPTTAGLFYKFIGGAVAANIVQIDCGAGLLDGVVINGTPAAVAAAGSRRVRFLAASVIGDYVDLVSDGTHWKVSGLSSVVGLGVN